VYIYLSNENETPVEVFFDDFRVEHIKSPVVQLEDYYPFGLTFNSYSRENTTPQDYKYNGKELQDELGLGWLDYDARFYDPVIGKWLSIDPSADKYPEWSPYNYSFNNPIRFVDPDGKDPIEGNKVLKVNFKTSSVTALHGEKKNFGFTVMDKPLYQRSRSEYIENFGPLPGNPSRLFEKFDAGKDFIDRNTDAAGRAGAWVEASMASKGYDYLEKTEDGGSVYREVRNLNETFGVESGFENVVTTKIVMDKDGKVTGGVDFQPGVAVDKKTGEKSYWIRPLISSPGEAPKYGAPIQLKPENKKPADDPSQK
jgi:RHS repeat-associated protein